MNSPLADKHHELLASLIDADELYQTAPCGYLSLAADGTIIKINRTLLKWLAYEEEELLAEKFGKLLSKGGQMHFEMFFLPLAGVHQVVKAMSYDIIRKDGSVLPVLVNASAIKDKDGKILALNSILTDNSERRQYEKELLKAKRIAESERKRLQFMADLVPEIIWTATADGFLDYVNARFCKYFDCNGRDLRSSFILSKVHPEELEELAKRWKNSLANGEDLEINIRLLNTDGDYEWHLLKAAKFMDEEGNLTNWFGSCANINDHVTALKKKDEFINIASHELKTPITSLKAVLQLLDRLKGDPTNKLIPTLIEKSNQNVNKVNQLVEELLDASHVNDGQLHLNKTKFNLTELISDCTHHIRVEQKYEIVTVGDEIAEVFADQLRIEQVINNFVSNAIKYAPDSKQVLISVNKVGDTVMVEVTDTGPGISAEKIPYLFDRYYQINNKGSKYSGLGLGLFICAEIIKKHNGEIGARSEAGVGSTFWFSLQSREVLAPHPLSKAMHLVTPSFKCQLSTLKIVLMK